jgi:hypothetical protein
MGVIMSQKIEFIAESRYAYEVCPRPYPATSAIPKWWKDEKPYSGTPDKLNATKIELYQGESNATFKKCTPMLDALCFGYIIPLWADVQVGFENGSQFIKWRVTEPVFEGHNAYGVEKPEGYGNQAFKFMNKWLPKLPKGYSLFITSPIGYPNSPFKALSGIIDYDKSNHPLLPPVFLKNDFEGILEKGTPMIQMIPFKRNDWTSSFSQQDLEQSRINMDRDVKATIVNNYVKNIWSKKSFR